MNEDHRDSRDFVDMPKNVYDDLLERSRRISLDTALTADEHRKLVQRERAERRQSGLKMPMNF